VLLGDRAGSRERAEVMHVLQARDLADCRAAGIPVHYDSLDVDDLAASLRDGTLPIVLNSMEYLHDDPTAHWFVVTGVDADNVYVNDPWVDLANGKKVRDMRGIAIPRATFDGVTSYGKKRERAAVLVWRGQTRRKG